MSYDYTGMINFIDSVIDESKNNVIVIAESINARSHAGDFYFADLAKNLAINDSVISYLTEVKGSLLSETSPIQVAQRVAAEGVENYDLAKKHYSGMLMNMLAVINAKTRN